MSTGASDVSVRKAAESDVPVILDFIRALSEYERLAHACVATEESLRDTLFTDPPAAEVLIASIGGEPVGFALFFHNYSTFLAQRGVFLEDLFVIPAARGRGVGRALLAALAQIAVQRNCGRLEWYVLDWNETAIGFYRRLGAVAMDEWTTFRVTDAQLRELASESPAIT
ncbi:MAG: GNAT family N-acetyltransferase [Gemmatimonadaceae bacterium]|nr:GNAT family N-acetyltransferase [Gemmatimonadaceae bacterium]